MDSARRQTDQQISSMRRELAADYDSLGGSMSVRLSEYLADFVDEEGRVEATALAGRKWARVRDELAREVTEVNAESMRTLDSRLGEVRQLTAEGSPAQSLMPRPAIDQQADVAWNRRKVEAAARGGIGRTPAEAGERMRQVADMNSNATARRVRTAVNGAENAGRMDAMLARGGSKRWVTVEDERVRDSHAELHGMVVPVGEEFPNGLMFPGDPSGPPEEVYNCRCTLEWVDTADSQPEELPQEWEMAEGQDILGTWQRRPDQFDFEIEDVLDAQGFDGLPRVVDADEFDEIVRRANGGDGLVMQRSYSAPDQATIDAYREQLYSGKWYVDCSTGGSQYGQGMYAAADYTGKVTPGMREEMVHYHKLNAEKLGGAVTTDEYKLGLIEDYVGRMSGTAEQRDATRTYLRTKAHVGEVTSDERRAAGKVLSRDSMRVLDTQADIITQAREGSFTYVETMTLDPSARIVSYEDANKGLHEYQRRLRDNSSDRASDLWAAFSRGEMTQEQVLAELDKPRTVTEIKDVGSWAAASGYDAINAEGHGKSGSYTVVLNRTKLIIRRP